MDDVNLIWCGPDNPPDEKRTGFKKTVRLDSLSQDHNVNLRIENISSTLIQNIPSLIIDLLEIGSYVYCADQSITRGGKTWAQNGKDWYRNFIVNIPVRNPDIWGRPEIKKCLSETLEFLSDDSYDFKFRQLKKDAPRQQYFDFSQGWSEFDTDSILLFSGGLDSLAGGLDEMVEHNRDIVLVSHRPMPKISSRQTSLVNELKREFEGKRKLLHIPVWVNKDPGITHDANQRTRSFLYASLAVAVAKMTQKDTIKFYENGIVSCNLPISEQIVGTRASRSTHPKALSLFSEFFSLLFDRPFKVENPFFGYTKSDVVKSIGDKGYHRLIASTHSCSHTRQTLQLNKHCGTCSQCVERRIATEFNGFQEFDPKEYYDIDLFRDSLKKPEDRTMVESYISNSLGLEDVSFEDFISRYPETTRIINQLGMPASKAADLVYNLHKRHGNQVSQVITQQIEANAGNLAHRKLSFDSLLPMLIRKVTAKKYLDSQIRRFPTPDGTTWDEIEIELVSDNSIRIRIGESTKRYTGSEIGFTDERKRDLLDNQWELLTLFAQKNGEISKRTIGFKPGKQKYVQALNRRLREFFGINSNPINRYSKKSGWTTKFKISDKSAGKS